MPYYVMIKLKEENMQEKILKKLNKHFDRTWRTLTQEERAEIIAFMKGILNAGEEFYKSSFQKLSELKPQVQELITEEMQGELALTKAIVEEMLQVLKFNKEDRLQEKIMLSESPQLLFSDIYMTNIGLNKAKFQVADVVEQANMAISQTPCTLPSRKLTSLVVRMDTMMDVFQNYMDVFKRQSLKVDSFFPELSTSHEQELGM